MFCTTSEQKVAAYLHVFNLFTSISFKMVLFICICIFIDRHFVYLQALDLFLDILYISKNFLLFKRIVFMYKHFFSLPVFYLFTCIWSLFKNFFIYLFTSIILFIYLFTRSF